MLLLAVWRPRRAVHCETTQIENTLAKKQSFTGGRVLTGPQGTRKVTIRGQEEVPGWRGKAEELIKENKPWAEDGME